MHEPFAHPLCKHPVSKYTNFIKFDTSHVKDTYLPVYSMFCFFLFNRTVWTLKSYQEQMIDCKYFLEQIRRVSDDNLEIIFQFSIKTYVVGTH